MNPLSQIESYVSLLNEFCNKQMFIDDGVQSYYETLVAKQLVINFQALQDLNIGEAFIKSYCSSSSICIQALPISYGFTHLSTDHLASAIKATDQAIRYQHGSFYLFGSVATGDSIKGWSDIDSLLLVDNHVPSSVPDLLELRKRMLD